MPRKLRNDQPSSSVASILEPSVGRQVTAPARATTAGLCREPHEPEGPPRLAPTAKREPVVESSITPNRSIMTESTRETRQSSKDERLVAPMIARQFSLTPRTDRAVRLLIDAVAQATGLELNQSELLRALLLLAERSLDFVHDAAAELGSLSRPRNDRADREEQHALELAIATAFLAAIQRVSAIGTSRPQWNHCA